jgi:CelD/BcsL family acetyltransferase involved in cellulose biosynthesis
MFGARCMSVVDTKKASAQKLTVRVQTGGVEIISQLADDWRRLCDEAPDGEVFYRPEWIEAHLRAFAPKATVIVVSVWSGECLRAVLPLIRERVFLSGLPAVRLIVPAGLYSCRAGLVHSPAQDDAEEVLRALWQALKALPGWNVLDVSYVLEGNGLDQISSIAATEGFPVARKRLMQSLYLPIGTSAQGQPPWMAGTRPKFRANLRRSRRQLEEQGTLALKHYTTADPEALQRFYDLEGSGWKGKQGTAIKCDPSTRQFYDAVAQAAARHGYFSLEFLELNGKAIAAHFGLNFHGRYYVPKAGYDEAFHRYGPGQLLIHEVLSESVTRGLRELDFVGPATWDESRWAPARRTHFRIFIFRKHLYGRLLHAVRISARDAAKSLLKRGPDESAPLPLLGKPQGAENESGGS